MWGAKRHTCSLPISSKRKLSPPSMPETDPSQLRTTHFPVTLSYLGLGFVARRLRISESCSSPGPEEQDNREASICGDVEGEGRDANRVGDLARIMLHPAPHRPPYLPHHRPVISLKDRKAISKGSYMININITAREALSINKRRANTRRVVSGVEL